MVEPENQPEVQLAPHEQAAATAANDYCIETLRTWISSNDRLTDQIANAVVSNVHL